MLKNVINEAVFPYHWKFRTGIPAGRTIDPPVGVSDHSSITPRSRDNRDGKAKKRTVMKKTKEAVLWGAALSATTSTYAQIGGIEDSVNDISDTIRAIFPIVLAVIFLVGFLFNAGHFFGENADIKKGITRILVFVLIAGAVVCIFTYLVGITV